MKKKILATVSTAIISLCMAESADAILASRLNGQAYYDTEHDLTWLADANYVETSGYVVTKGELTWSEANTWIDGLVINGVDGWRLPKVFQDGTSEMGTLWSDTLGNIPYFDSNGNPDQTGWGLTNTGPFSNFKVSDYWSDGNTPNVLLANIFDTYHGAMWLAMTHDSNYTWAVHSGDVGAVPEPATMWLVGSGIIGLIGAARKRVRI